MFIEVDGRQTFCGTGGREFDASQPNIVFIHGTALDNTLWTLFARYYARRGYNVFAFDLPGNGHSEGPTLPTIEALAEWTANAMHACGVEKASIVGHSMGALIGLQLAATQPSLVERLIPLGIALPMGVAPPFLAAAEANKRAAIDMFVLFGYGYGSQLGGNPIAGINIFNSGLRLVEQAGPGVMHAGLNACNDYRPDEATLDAVTCPVSIIQGDEDSMTPIRSAQKLCDRLSNATLTRIPDCGHMSMQEKPEEVHLALQAALQR